MLRSRIIPCLLVRNGGLVKTVQFKGAKYLGDPINAARIFNEKEADELMVLDIEATTGKKAPNFDLIAKLAAECRMPLCYGGGITTAEQAAYIVDLGVEKVAVSAAAIANPSLLTQIASAVGRQSVVAVLDIRKRSGVFGNGYELFTRNGKTLHKIDPIALVKQFEDSGVGEIVINSIDRDGQMQGYDLDLVRTFRKVVSVPVTFLGGAGSLAHMRELISRVGVTGVAAGSLFVFKGKYRAVLINYPSSEQKLALCRGTSS